MKRAALAMLAPLAGCNWVFGLEPTHAAPDAPDAAPPGVMVHVALLVETLDGNGGPTAPTETAFPDLARLQASTLDGQAPVTVTAGADGTVSIPMEIATMPWRLIYQRQGDVVREYQNLPAEAHVIEPLLGPVTRTPPPAGSGYIVTPSSYSGSHAINRVYTVGAWTEGTTVLPPMVSSLDYDLTGAASLSGGLATPKAGDRGILVDYVVDGATSCRKATGSVDFSAAMPEQKPNVNGSWVTTQNGSPMVDTQFALINTADVDPFTDATGRTAHEQYGFLAANDVPLFTRPPDATQSLFLKNPPMVVLRVCNLPVSGPTVNEPSYLAARFGRAVHTEISAPRTLPGGGTVINGLSIVTLGTTNFMVRTAVAFPRAVKLGQTDLFGTTESVPFARSTTAMELTWSKLRATDVASFWEVALLKVAGPAITRERVYVTTKPSVMIMPSDLTSGTHVFEITAYAGRNAATTGDFRGATGDQAISVTHTRTFVVQ